MNLSKSKYCKGVQCPKILWLEKHRASFKEDLGNEAVFENGNQVGDLAMRLLGPYEEVPFHEDLNVMIEDTQKLLEKDSIVVAEASFNYNNNFCSVDLLKKENDSYEMYEVKSSTEIKDIYIDDISYQFYVLENLGYNVTKACLVTVDSSYVRGELLDIHSLFKITDVTDQVLLKQQEIEKNIEEFDQCVKESEEPIKELGMQCVSPYDCAFFKYCTKDLETPNVFDLRRMRNSSKFKLYQSGVVSYPELLKSEIDPLFKEQIEYTLKDKKDKVLVPEIKEFMQVFKGDLYFLDFETFQEAIPRFEGTRPYQQIPFQYSLHIQKGDTLEHKEYLAEEGADPRRDLALQLLEDIPVDACVIAYNNSFEKMVIRDLAEAFPDLSDALLQIESHIEDLMIPFKNRWYYTKNMLGSYSIKYVLPALFPDDPSLDYHSLEEVHNGKEAQQTFLSLKDLEEEERIQTRFHLLRYCELDTYAMVKVYEKLREVIGE